MILIKSDKKIWKKKIAKKEREERKAFGYKQKVSSIQQATEE